MKRKCLGAALAGALLFARPAVSQDRDDRGSGPRISVSSVERFVRALRPDPLRAAEDFFKVDLEGTLRGLDPAKLEAGDPSMRAAIDKVAELYRRGGFESVKALAKTGKIPPDASKKIAAVRNAMVSQALATMASRFGEVRVNDFSSATTAQSDIDQTFFPVLDTEPSGERTVREDPDSGKPMDGAWLKHRFGEVYESLFRIDPDRMEVSSHAREASIPDWRNHPDTADFMVKLARGSDALRQNVEAYFLEGAYRRQVDRRSFEAKERLFRTFRPLATHTGETAEIVVKLATGDVGVTPRAARLKVYKKIRPEWRKGYSFGACVGNLLFFSKHARPEEMRERAKYVARSVEDGVASLAMPGASGELPLYFDLDEAGRRDLLRRALPGVPADRFEAMFRTYQIADDVQFETVGGKRVKRTDFSPAAQAKFYAPILDAMAAEKLGAGKTAADIDAAQRDAWVQEAAERFRKESRALLVENCVLTAGARVRDWLDPARIDPKKLPKNQRRRFKADPEAFAARLRTSALSEISDAFLVLEEDTVRRIVEAETDPEFRGALEDVRRNAELRRELLRKSSVARTKERLAAVVAEIREKGERLGRVVPEFATSWRGGAYTPGAIGIRTLYSVKETLGWHYEADFRALENAGKRIEGKFDAKKLVGNAMSLGGADALVSILRQGQDGGWDPGVIAWAAGMEFLSNVPGVAPALAVKGALFDGEIEGAAVLAAAYFYPGVGQAYMVWNLSKGVLELVAIEMSDGVGDLLYQGYVPDKSAGVRGFVERYLPGRISQDIVASAASVTPPTLLWFVPKPTLRERRLALFEHYDARIGGALAGRGLSPEELDRKRRELAPALFAKEVNDYCDRRPGTPWGDDAGLQNRWAVYDATLTGRALRAWLDRPAVREALRDRMVKDYLAGLQRSRVAEGAALADDVARSTDEAWDLLDRMRSGLERAWASVRDDAPVVSGLPDLPEPEWDFFESVLREVPEGEPELRIVAPDGGIALGDLAALRAEVFAPPGRFEKPYEYLWTFPAAAAQDAGEDGGHAFVQGRPPKGPLQIRLEVKDALGKRVGTTEAAVPVTETGAVSDTVATHRLVKITLTAVTGRRKQPGDRADVEIDTMWLPVPITEGHSAEASLEDHRRRLTANHGPGSGTGRTTSAGGGRVIVSWTVEYDDAVKLATPFRESDVPKPTRVVRAGEGPQL